jgi:hypothetical protein
MKLAEALLQRSDAQRRVDQLRDRVTANARYQEGEEPIEDAAELLRQAVDTLTALESLVVRINLTNARTTLADGSTMTAALARRETLRATHALLANASDAARGASGGYRQLRSELRMFSALPVAELRDRADAVAQDLRELDVEIQKTNWEAELQN